MMPIKTYEKIKTIVLYFVIKKHLEISFQNGPEHETTSLNDYNTEQAPILNLPRYQPTVHSFVFLNLEIVNYVNVARIYLLAVRDCLSDRIRSFLSKK